MDSGSVLEFDGRKGFHPITPIADMYSKVKEKQQEKKEKLNMWQYQCGVIHVSKRHNITAALRLCF